MYKAQLNDITEYTCTKQVAHSLSQSGVPRLLESVRNGQYQASEALLRRGADVNKKSETASFPLHEAAALSGTGSELVHLLLNHNASPNKVDDNRRSAVHVAATGGNDEAVQALISSGASINKRDESVQTPLHAAARAGSVAALRTLLNALASTTCTDDDGNTPAGVCRDDDVVQLLHQSQ